MNEFVEDHPFISFFIICGVVCIFEAIFVEGCTCGCGCC